MITKVLTWAAAITAIAAPLAASAGETGGPAGFDLSPGKRTAISVASTPERQAAAAMPHNPHPKGMQGDVSGEKQYIDGPSWNYQTGKRGPKFEIAALGGGMESAPFLAHVGVDWRF